MVWASEIRAGRSVVVIRRWIRTVRVQDLVFFEWSADRVNPLTYKLTLNNCSRFYPVDIIPPQLFDVKDQVESRNREQFTDMVTGIDDFDLVPGGVEALLDFDEDTQP